MKNLFAFKILRLFLVKAVIYENKYNLYLKYTTRYPIAFLDWRHNFFVDFPAEYYRLPKVDK